jgi:hypothetical protein
MPTYVQPPIESNPEDLFQLFVADLQARVPGWEPADGNLDVWLAEGVSQIAAQVAETASDFETAAFRWFGENLVGVAPVSAVAATALVTFTATDTAGHTIPAGTAIGIPATDGTLLGFSTIASATIPAASSSVSGVTVVAAEAGSAANGLAGPGQLVDALTYLNTSVVLGSATDGGSDEEATDAYLDRLAAELRLQTISPILPQDFAQLAKRVTEIDRCLALDGYKPSDGTSNNALTVTLVPVNPDGTTISAGGKTALAAQFAEGGDTPAIVNFVVYVADPHYTSVDITWTGTAWETWTPADVQAAGNAALTAWLDPATWGQPTFGEEKAWELEPVVRLGKAFDVLYGVEGLKHVDSLTIGLAGGAQTSADHTLPTTNAEPAPLPLNTGTISGTVVAP